MFYGWVIVVVSTLGVLMSIPGQTIGVSVFTDHLLGATPLSRLQLSNAYLVGTVLSGALLPWGGRLLDRLGARLTAMVSAAGLGATLCYLAASGRIARLVGVSIGDADSTAVSLVVLVLGFIALRFSGQGMLTMVSRTMLGKWFDRRRGMVSGIAGVFISFGFASAPLVLSKGIGAVGWRGTWLALAAVVGLGMTTIAWLFYRDNPEECGLRMDGVRRGEGDGAESADEGLPELDRDQACRTVAFWAVTLALAFHGLVLTGITFHIVDIGAEAGLVESEAVSIFLPMAVLSTSIGYLAGHTSDRVPLQPLIVIMMVFQALGLITVGHLDDTAWSWLAIAGLGVSGGFFGPLSTVALPRFFGRTHLGAIAGVQMMCMVVASALGPSFLAASRQMLGSYRPGLYACCALPAVVAVLTLFARNPRRRDITR